MPEYKAEHARNVRVRTLVLAGRESTAHQRYSAAELLRVCGAPKKSFAYVEKAAYLMHEDNQQGVYEKIVKFVFEGAAA